MVVLRGVEMGGSDGDGGVGVVRENGEGAGCVEADATDGGRVNVSLSQRALDGEADAAPDVGGRLFLS